MTRAARWSEADLKLHQQRKSAPVPVKKPALAAAIPLAPTRAAGVLATKSDTSASLKRKAARKSRLQRVIESIRTANLSGSYKTGQFIELRFDGAMMLSPNELYAMHFSQRIPYRKAWHDAVHWAMLSATGGPRNFPMLETFEMSIHRRAKQLCDTDSIDGYFKAPIDALRYAGIIKDDNPKYFKRFASITQETGKPLVVIRVERFQEIIHETSA